MILPIGNSNTSMRILLGCRRSLSESPGFTFVEVMLSIVIVSVGIVAVTQAFSTILHALAVSRHDIKAVLFLEEKIEELEELNRVEGGLEKGVLTGSFANEKSYGWQAKISGTGVEDEELGQVDLSVRWKEGRRGGTVSLSTFILGGFNTKAELR